MGIPNNIKESHLLQAIEKINEIGLDSIRASTKFELYYKGRKYPPKEVIRYANVVANGTELRDFSGGDESNNYLINSGFTIVLKNTDKIIGLDYTKKKARGINHIIGTLNEAAQRNGEMAMDHWQDKNIILYGPPGTGKTYNTVKYAVAIIEKKAMADIEAEVMRDGYEQIKKRYDEYKEKKRVQFTTFHQSYGYEEFIEGIKPVISEEKEGEIYYTLEPGVFKDFCDTASRNKVLSIGDEKFLNPTVWKVSLEGAGDNPTKRECFENGHIRIGWDHLDEKIEYDTPITESDSVKRILLDFQEKMEIGDIVVSLRSKESIDGIGIITGEYEYDRSYSHYRRKRNVRWLVKNINENILDLNGNKNLTLSSVYRLNRITITDLKPIIEKYSGENNLTDFVAVKEPQQEDNYVFIIDEINRGNISKIFGELITLIENQKRLGMTEEITTTLPYSKKKFGVPSNVYIVGTMNTADRSIALLDTALRRRFRFVEMLPNASVLDGVMVEEIDIKSMLEKINKRIEVLYDREHMIGHGYFTELKQEPTLKKLAHIFENSIIPLLQEYFYEDYQKIQLILGDLNKENEDKFVRETEVNRDLFGHVFDIDIDNLDLTYKMNTAAFTNPESYKKIYNS